MTTIRNKKTLRQYGDHATPDDRLRHSAGMGIGERERLSRRKLERELAALKADAMRYRWLRSWECINHQSSPWCVCWDSSNSHDLGQTHPIEGAELDAALDAAMRPEANS